MIDNGYTKTILDHGYIKLIGSMGTDETVIEAARMSTGKGFTDWDSVKECTKCKLRFPGHQPVQGWPCVDGIQAVPGHDIHDWKIIAGDASLLDFLYANRHMTPFEMGELCIEVKAPIFVFREWHRHRTQSYNEFSARYAMMPDEHYLPEPGRIQRQSQLNKQGSGSAMEPEYAAQVLAELERQQSEVYDRYEAWVGDGLAKEVARINTPVSRYSKMRAKTDVRSWLAFLSLRCENGAQLEIRQYANALAGIIKSIWPRTYDLWLEYDFLSVRFSRTEMRHIREMYRELDRAGHLSDLMNPKSQTAMTEKQFKVFESKFNINKEEEYKHLLKKGPDGAT